MQPPLLVVQLLVDTVVVIAGVDVDVFVVVVVIVVVVVVVGSEQFLPFEEI